MNVHSIFMFATTILATACGPQRLAPEQETTIARTPSSRATGQAPQQAEIEFSVADSITEDLGLIGYQAVVSDLVVETTGTCGSGKTTINSPTNPAMGVLVCAGQFPEYPILLKATLKITGPNSVRNYVLNFSDQASFPKELSVARRVEGTKIIYSIRDKGGDLIGYSDVERYFIDSSVYVEYEDLSFLSALRITHPSQSETKVEFVDCPTCIMDPISNLPAGFTVDRQAGYVIYKYANCDVGNYVLAGTVRRAAGSNESIKVTVHINVRDVASSAKHRLFATSKLYKGDFGGISVADTECKSLATAAGLGGNWKSILSDNMTNARDRLTINGPVVDMMGNPVANNAADLWDGSIQTAIRYTEKLTTVSWHLVFTGTHANGARDQRTVALNCGTSKSGPAWSSRTSPAGVETGRTDRKDAGWIAIYEGGDQAANACGNDGMLYCLEQ